LSVSSIVSWGVGKWVNTLGYARARGGGQDVFVAGAGRGIGRAPAGGGVEWAGDSARSEREACGELG